MTREATLDFLHDPIYQFVINVLVGLLVGIVASITSIWIYRKQRNRKEIFYEVISNAPVLSIGKEVSGKVEIRFGSKLVKDLRVVVIRLCNSGNVPILVSDYVEPITFEFHGQGEILDSEILETEPTGIKASLTRNTKSVVLDPLMLNSQDAVKIKMLLTELGGNPKVNGRIVGVKNIFELSKRSERYLSRRNLFLSSGWLFADLLLALVVIFLAVNINSIPPTHTTTNAVNNTSLLFNVYFILSIIISVIVLLQLISFIRAIRRWSLSKI